mgnify:CR=1 FL=1
MLSGIGLITLTHLILSVVHEVLRKTSQKKFVVVNRLVEILVIKKRIQLLDFLVRNPEKVLTPGCVGSRTRHRLLFQVYGEGSCDKDS